MMIRIGYLLAIYDILYNVYYKTRKKYLKN